MTDVYLHDDASRQLMPNKPTVQVKELHLFSNTSNANGDHHNAQERILLAKKREINNDDDDGTDSDDVRIDNEDNDNKKSTRARKHFKPSSLTAGVSGANPIRSSSSSSSLSNTSESSLTNECNESSDQPPPPPPHSIVQELSMGHDRAHACTNLESTSDADSESLDDDDVNVDDGGRCVFFEAIVKLDSTQLNGSFFFCLSCCRQLATSLDFMQHSQGHSSFRLSDEQEGFLSSGLAVASSRGSKIVAFLMEKRMKAKFLRGYAHDLLVPNEETALCLEKLNKDLKKKQTRAEQEDEENFIEFDHDSEDDDDDDEEEEDERASDRKSNNALLFIDYSIIKFNRIVNILKVYIFVVKKLPH